MQAAIETLSDVFIETPTVLLLPNSPDYLSELTVYWNAANQELKPEAIAKPKTTTQLSTIIKVLAEHKVEFAIRSGAGTPIPTVNNTTGFLIALRELNADISYPSDGVVRVGPGLRWGEVYHALAKKNSTAVGGRMLQVGVGGFLLGGGLSHLSHEHGLGCDNVVSYEVVLASGENVTANAQTNSDLFWALKGGGNNFGVVSQIDLKIIPQKEGVWGGMIVIAADHVNEALQALAEWQEHDQPKDPKASAQLILIKGPGMGSPDAMFCTMVLYYGDNVEYPESLKRLTALPFIHKTLRLTTHYNIVEELSGSFDVTKRHIFHTGTFLADGDINKVSKDYFEEAIAATGVYSEDQHSYNTFTYQPIGKSMLAKGEGTRAIGALSSGAPYVWYVAAVQYSSKSFDDTVRKALEGATVRLDKHTKSKQKYSNFLYLNDASVGQDPIHTYGDSNLERMEQIRSKYDPSGMFSTLCAGGFKLRKRT